MIVTRYDPLQADLAKNCRENEFASEIARFSLAELPCLGPLSATKTPTLVEAKTRAMGLMRPAGLEPATPALKVPCSTN